MQTQDQERRRASEVCGGLCGGRRRRRCSPAGVQQVQHVLGMALWRVIIDPVALSGLEGGGSPRLLQRLQDAGWAGLAAPCCGLLRPFGGPGCPGQPLHTGSQTSGHGRTGACWLDSGRACCGTVPTVGRPRMASVHWVAAACWHNEVQVPRVSRGHLGAPRFGAREGRQRHDQKIDEIDAVIWPRHRPDGSL